MDGDLNIITGGYGTTRGEAMRFMTLLGEPNVGGMAAPIVLLVSVYVVQNPLLKIIIALVAVVLLALSVSKAGLVGFGIAIILIIFLQHRLSNRLLGIKLLQTTLFAVPISVMAIVFAIVLSFSNPSLVDKVQVYAQTAVTAFVGGGDPDHVSPSFVDDLSNRLFKMTSEGIEQAKTESSFYILNVIYGSSFGIAGTAAEEIRGSELVIKPHNGFAETYFVGGVLMLFLFMLILYFAFRRLWWLSKKNYLFGALLASFVLCTAFTVSYPVMSNIFVGSLFWLTIGIAASHSITNKEGYR
jgi:O-antigen ligase